MIQFIYYFKFVDVMDKPHIFCKMRASKEKYQQYLSSRRNIVKMKPEVLENVAIVNGKRVTHLRKSA